MRTKPYWLLERKTKFCSGTRIRRFKGISRYHRTQVQSQMWKTHDQLLAKIMAYSHFPRCYQWASSTSVEIRVLSLSFPHVHLLENWARECEGVNFIPAGIWLGLKMPVGWEAGISNDSLAEKATPAWAEYGKAGGVESAGVSSRMPGVRDASPHGLGVPWKSERRAESDRWKVTFSALFLRWVSVKTAELCPLCKAEAAEVSSFSYVLPTKD